MPIEPLTADEEASLSQYHLGGPEEPSILGRIGRQAGNAPSDIFNDLSRLLYNVGVASPESTQAPEVPKPFDIPPPTSLGQSAVDIGASMARALPLILGGETAGEGVAELLGAAPTAAKIIGSAVGFGGQGLTESPEQAALQTTLGAGFRAADFLPLRYKAPLALGIGAVTGAASYYQDDNATKAAGVGLVNAALPFILKGRTEDVIDKSRAEVPAPGAPMAGASIPPQGDLFPTLTPSTPPPRVATLQQANFLQNLFTPEAHQPFLFTPPGSLVREPTFTEREALLYAQGRTPAPTTPAVPAPHGPTPPLPEQPLLQLGRPEGSLIRNPLLSGLEARQAANLQPPEGALIPSVSITTEEALRGTAGFKEPPSPRGFRLSGDPELDLTTGVRDTRPDMLPPQDQPNLFAPPGSLTREPTFSAGEAGNFADVARRRATRPPEGSLIREASFTPNEINRVLEARKLRNQPPALLSPPPPPSPAKPMTQLEQIMAQVEANRKRAEAMAQNVDTTINASREVQADTILHPADGEMAQKAAAQINARLEGVQEGAGDKPAQMLFTDLTPGNETTLSVPVGSTVADLRQAVVAKRAEYAAKEPLPPLTLKGAPPSARPTGYRKAVRFRGETFEGATHEESIAKLAKRFPNYRESSRKTEPIQHGYITPEGKFEQNLLNIARAEEQKAAPKPPPAKPVATLQPKAEAPTPPELPPNFFKEMAILENQLQSQAKRVFDMSNGVYGKLTAEGMSANRAFLKELEQRYDSMSAQAKSVREAKEAAAAKPPPPVESKAAAVTPTPPALKGPELPVPTVTRSKDFATEGTYEVTFPSGNTTKIFRDPENGWWYDQKDIGSKEGPPLPLSTESKKDALQALAKREAKVAAPSTIATLQEEIAKAAAKIKAKVEGANVKLGETTYKIRKQGDTWYYEDQPLSKTKQGAVKQLKQLHAASTSQAPSLEKAQEQLAEAAEGQYQAGDKVLVNFAGDWEAGTIQTANAETGIHQVRLEDGSVVDVRDAKIKSMAVQGKFEATRESEIKQIGSLEDFRKLEKDNLAKSKGMKRAFKPGEAGAIPLDVAVRISRYVVAPIAGAAIGAAMSDQDHRLSGAVKGAIALGGAAILGPRIFALLAEGHPDINVPSSYPAALKETVTSIRKVSKFKEAVTRARTTGTASGADKVALFFDKYLFTNIETVRAIMKSHGEINALAKLFHLALPVLTRTQKGGLNDFEQKLVSDYFEGKVPQVEFEAKMGDAEVAQAATTARQVVTALQKVTVKGINDPKLKSVIEGSYDKYLTTSYRIFTDKKYFPTDEQVMKVVSEMKDQRSPLDVRFRLVQEELKTLKENHALYHSNKIGESIAKLLFRKDDLTAAYQDALGIYTDPIERIISTTTKLLGPARSAAFFNEVAGGISDTGLKYAYTEWEMGNTLELLRQQKSAAALSGDTSKIATLQSQIEVLSGYVWDSKNEAHGRLSEHFIAPKMHDALAQKDLLLAESNSYVAKHLRDATTLFKYNKTVLSPLQFSRQIMNVPLLGVMSRTGPGDWIGAFNALRDPAERAFLDRIGVSSGDIVSGMLQHDLNHLLRGNLDKFSLTNPLVGGLQKWQNIWRTPDLVVRVAAFRKQYQQMLDAIPANLSESERAIAVQKAENAAIDFTNRYTMNYEVIPPGVRIFSNLPFANQFLTWMFELTRITKNLGYDAIVKKDPYAMGVLAGFGSVPFAMQAASEAMLSPQDRKDWDKVKGLLPDYAKSNFVWVTHRDAQGHFHYINFTGLLIHDSYLKMMRDVMAGDRKAFAADNPIFGWENTPLLNIATNQISGEDIHSGQKFHSAGDRLDSIRRDFAPPLLGTDLDKFVQAITPNAQGGLGLTDIRTGQTASIGSMLESYLTATRAYTTDLGALERRAYYAAKADIDDNRAQLSRILHSNARADVKQRAMDQFRFTTKQTMMELLRQIRPELQQ